MVFEREMVTYGEPDEVEEEVLISEFLPLVHSAFEKLCNLYVI